MSHDLRSLQGSQLRYTYYLIIYGYYIYIWYIYIYMILVIFHCQMWQYCCERADLFSLIFKKRIKQLRVGSTENRKWRQRRRQVGRKKKAYFVSIIGLLMFKSTSVVIVCNPGSGWLRLYSVFSRLRNSFLQFVEKSTTGSRTREVRVEDSWTLERNPTNHPNPNGKKTL